MTAGLTTRATYPTVRDFPHGLRCADCDRPLNDGAPYAERLEGVHPDGIPVVLIVCVYCGLVTT